MANTQEVQHQFPSQRKVDDGQDRWVCIAWSQDALKAILKNVEG